MNTDAASAVADATGLADHQVGGSGLRFELRDTRTQYGQTMAIWRSIPHGADVPLRVACLAPHYLKLEITENMVMHELEKSFDMRA